MGADKKQEINTTVETRKQVFFLPQLAETFGIIVRVNEKGEVVRLGESSGLTQTKKFTRRPGKWICCDAGSTKKLRG